LKADKGRIVCVAEEVAGEYVWGVYDLLLLPPSFPYGGMENPCLTFVTPTLLAGDRSLVNVVAHEIAHSWTGNLVTNATWEHFWLNEGVFALSLPSSSVTLSLSVYPEPSTLKLIFFECGLRTWRSVTFCLMPFGQVWLVKMLCCCQSLNQVIRQ